MPSPGQSPKYWLADRISSCAIRPECVARIKAHKDKIINVALVAEGFRYELRDEENRRFSLEAGLQSGALKLEAGADAAAKAKEMVSGQTAVVIGVALVRDDIIDGAEPCSSPVAYSPSGAATTSISGGGGRGNIGAGSADTQSFGRTATRSAKGKESSECSDDFERTMSAASSRGTVAHADNDGTILFTSELQAQGGHYATCATCASLCQGNCCGKTGHDTSATASVVLHGTVSVLVRSRTINALRLSWADMPPGATLSIAGVSSSVLQDGFRVEGSGARDVAISDIGTYNVTATLEDAVSGTGRGHATKTLRAVLRAAGVETSTATPTVEATVATIKPPGLISVLPVDGGTHYVYRPPPEEAPTVEPPTPAPVEQQVSDTPVAGNIGPYFVDFAPPRQITAGQIYSYLFKAEDRESDDLTFDFSNAPQGATWLPVENGVEFTWRTRAEEASDVPYEIAIRISDGSHTIERPFRVNVMAAPATVRPTR